MTIICPKCDSRFRDPPADIPLSRPLQCSNCEHEWVRASAHPSDGETQTIEAPVLAEPRQQVDAPPLAPSMDDLIADRTDEIRINLPVVTDTPEDAAETKDEPIFIDRAVAADQQAKRKRVLFPVLGLACIGLLASVLSLPHAMVDTSIQTGSVLKAAGLPISPAPLSIAEMKTIKTKKDGIRQLIVRGEIENIAAHTVPVPPIKLTMRGEQNVRLYAWTVSAAKGELKAGERSRFTAIAHDYPREAVDVEVEFENITAR